MTNPTFRRSLFAVLFEVEPEASRTDEYLRIAGALRPQLLATEGFLENERFRSRTRPGALLSLSLWDSEKALIRWRAAGPHHAAQARGRAGVLAGYRLRVGEVTLAAGRLASGRDPGWMRHDETETAEDKAVALVAGEWGVIGLLEETSLRQGALHAELFGGLTDPNRGALLTAWRGVAEAEAFARIARDGRLQATDVYAIRILRNYGMTDRREAPQHHV
jgi:heme-degrading monooxygenase HmoA